MRGPDRTIRINQTQLVGLHDLYRHMHGEKEAIEWTIGEDTYERVEVSFLMNSGGGVIIDVWDIQEEMDE